MDDGMVKMMRKRMKHREHGQEPMEKCMACGGMAMAKGGLVMGNESLPEHEMSDEFLADPLGEKEGLMQSMPTLDEQDEDEEGHTPAKRLHVIMNELHMGHMRGKRGR